MHIYPFPGEVTQAEHRALRDITQPRPDQIWYTAYADLKSMWDAAIENYEADPTPYNQGRMESLGNATKRILERYKAS